MRQAQFNQLAEFLAYNDPRVQATTQFLLRDAAPLNAVPEGLAAVLVHVPVGPVQPRGRAKPAAFAYTFPLVVYPGGAGIDRLLGPAALPAERLRGHHPVLVAARPEAVRARRLAAAGRAGEDELPRLLHRGTFPTPGPGGEYRAGFLDAETGAVKVSSLFTAP